MSPMDHADAPARHAVPEWAGELIAQYESNAANQFILYGNITDRMVLPLPGGPQLGSLSDFLLRVLMPRFDVILSYDIGNGLRVEQGGKVLAEWRRFKEQPELPKPPRAAVETLTHYFRYCANLAQMGRRRIQVGCFVRAAQLVAPALRGGFSYDLNALALLIRDWASDRYLARHALATFLITENLNDLHPLLVNNPRAARIKIPLPSPGDIEGAIRMMASRYPTALGQYGADLGAPARQLAGAALDVYEMEPPPPDSSSSSSPSSPSTRSTARRRSRPGCGRTSRCGGRTTWRPCPWATCCAARWARARRSWSSAWPARPACRW